MHQAPQIPNYKIVKCLGEGGMGSVWLAEHLHLPRKVAIKWLLPELSGDSEHKLRFRKEAHILATLDHPNIIRLYDYYETTKDHFLVMEYFEGISLKVFLEQNKYVPESQALPLFEQILAAFVYAHQKQIIHRDVKPSNILLDVQTGQVKVLDFGISKMLDNDFARTRTGVLLGSPAYMSPEQVRGEGASLVSDIYSLGVLFYEILTGRLPYSLKTKTEYEILEAVIQQPFPEKPSHISEALYACLQKATQKQPQHRYPNAKVFWEDIQRIRLQKSTVLPLNQTSPKIPLWTIAVTGIIVLLFLAFWLLPSKKQDEAWTSQDFIEHVEKFLYAINTKDSMAIMQLVKPSLVHRYTGSKLAQLGTYQLQDSISISPSEFQNASMITAIVPVRYEHHSQSLNQQLKIIFDEKQHKIHAVQVYDLPKTTAINNTNVVDEKLALEAFLKQFYSYADGQNVEGLLSCYDERVEKWFAKVNVDKDFIREESAKYVRMVQDEQSSFQDLSIKNLPNDCYEMSFKLSYNYSLRKEPTKKHEIQQKVLMKVRKGSSGYKIYWIAFEED